MSKPKTHVVMIIDKSGSMHSIRRQAVENYNEQIQQMKENSKDQEITASLITFNGNVFEHLWRAPADGLEESDLDSFTTAGNTALYDAIGYTVTKIRSEAPADDDTAYLLIIISDGEENASIHYNSEQIRGMLEEVKATGRWTVSYMGCSAHQLETVAQSLNISPANMAVWSNASAEAASSSLRSSRSRQEGYYQMRTKGLSSTSNLYNDVDEVADFTQTVPPPSQTPDQNSLLWNQAPVVNSVDLNSVWKTAQQLNAITDSSNKMAAVKETVRKNSVFAQGRNVSK